MFKVYGKFLISKIKVFKIFQELKGLNLPYFHWVTCTLWCGGKYLSSKFRNAFPTFFYYRFTESWIKCFLVYETWFVNSIIIWRYFRGFCVNWDLRLSDCLITISYLMKVTTFKNFIITLVRRLASGVCKVVLMKKLLKILFKLPNSQTTDIFQNHKIFISVGTYASLVSLSG